MTDSKESQHLVQGKDNKLKWFLLFEITYRIHAMESYWDKYWVWIWKWDGLFYDCYIKSAAPKAQIVI